MLRYKEIKLALLDYVKEMGNGEKLPSRTALIRQLDSSRATIDKAIRELEREGVLESRFGSGTYVARKLDGVLNNAENWCLIVPNITETIYNQLASGVGSVARDRNANVIVCSAENSAEKQMELIKRLVMASVDGFIIVPAITTSAEENIGLYRSLRKSKIPFVFCNRDVEGVFAPIVKSNDFYGGYIATLHLIDHGYQNIAYLTRQYYRSSVDRCQGYVSALQHRNIEIERRRILMPSESRVQDCGERLNGLLRSNIPVDAVFCFNDSIAMEAMEVIRARGYRISEDIGVIGYDNLDICDGLEPPLTSVAYQIVDIGKMAARVLGKHIDGKAPEGFAYYLMEPEVIAKASCLGIKRPEKQRRERS